MRKRLSMAAVALAAVIVWSTAVPRKAHADETTDILLWSAVGIAAVVGVALVATYFTRDETKLFLTGEEPFDPDGARPRDGLSFATDCRRPDGTIAIACW